MDSTSPTLAHHCARGKSSGEFLFILLPAFTAGIRTIGLVWRMGGWATSSFGKKKKEEEEA